MCVCVYIPTCMYVCMYVCMCVCPRPNRACEHLCPLSMEVGALGAFDTSGNSGSSY